MANGTVNAVRAEWGKLWSVVSPPACLLGAVLLTLITACSLASDFVVDVDRGDLPASATMPVLDALVPAAQTGLALIAAFALLPVTSEFGTGSIRSTLWAQPVRSRVLHAKAAVTVAVAVPVGLVTTVLCWWASTILLTGHVLGADREVAAWLPVAARTSMLFGLAALLAVGLAAMIRSAIGTLAAALVLLIGTGVLPESAGAWAPAGAGTQFVGWSEGTHPPVLSMLVLLAWAGGAYALGWWTFERRDA